MSGASRHPGLAPLVQLNAHIRARLAERAGPAVAGEPDAAQELASVRRFRQAWERGQALDTIEQALARKPANAGPLNSHVLLLQTLDALRELSPDYLRRLLVQLDALHWLEQARQKYPPPQAKGAKPARRVKRKG
ncbi:MAG TPA: DUF2894 domain-containing protein [Ramlibacter sp.]|jgi:hypothetical protein|nr:DUF2894 domain-containing protein [Ramlibacter sp.]